MTVKQEKNNYFKKTQVFIYWNKQMGKFKQIV